MKQAEELLAIDAKTLGKRLRRAGIEPRQSPQDKRVRLLSEEQVAALKGSILDRTVKVARADSPLGAMGRLLNNLVRRIRKVEGRVDSLEGTTSMIQRQVDEILSERARRIEHLERELQWKTEEWERTLTALVGNLAGIRARYEEHEHQQTQQTADGDGPNESERYTPDPDIMSN